MDRDTESTQSFCARQGTPKKTAEHDIFFVPQCSLHTGYINAHEMAVDDTGRPLVAASFFNCVLAVDVMRGATPVWSPSPIKELKAADVCHVNGICIDRGRLRFASALAAVGQVGGWREQHDGGVIFDCLAGKTVATSLSRPHSPRLYDGRLWVLNSGNGTIGFIRSGKLTEMTMCPGYPRGLTFLGNSAVIGVSRLRESGSGTNLPLAGRLQQKKITSRCGVVILDIGTGKPLHEAYFGEGVDEIFDVVVLQGVKNPKLVKPGSQEAARSYLFRKGASAARVRPAARIVKQAKGEF